MIDGKFYTACIKAGLSDDEITEDWVAYCNDMDETFTLALRQRIDNYAQSESMTRVQFRMGEIIKKFTK
jgi:hypothetical protein